MTLAEKQELTKKQWLQDARENLEHAIEELTYVLIEDDFSKLSYAIAVKRVALNRAIREVLALETNYKSREIEVEWAQKKYENIAHKKALEWLRFYEGTEDKKTAATERMSLEIEKYIDVLIAKNFNENSDKIESQKEKARRAIHDCVAEDKKYYNEDITRRTAGLLLYQAEQIARWRVQNRKEGK